LLETWGLAASIALLASFGNGKSPFGVGGAHSRIFSKRFYAILTAGCYGAGTAGQSGVVGQ
jgi:hypothetical protein